jgi:hypothetical protein
MITHGLLPFSFITGITFSTTRLKISAGAVTTYHNQAPLYLVTCSLMASTCTSLPFPYQFVRYLQAHHSFVQVLAATLYEFEDVCWQAPIFLGFCLNVLNDGVPVLS